MVIGQQPPATSLLVSPLLVAMPYSFGAAITGAGSGANQQACASVAWGPAGAPDSAGFPVTFSHCD